MDTQIIAMPAIMLYIAIASYMLLMYVAVRAIAILHDITNIKKAAAKAQRKNEIAEALKKLSAAKKTSKATHVIR